MIKPTLVHLLIAFLFLAVCNTAISQTYKPFTVRKNIEVRGSMLVVGNSILGKDNQSFNLSNQDNQDISMQYIDIDSDGSTFSSSSADIQVPPQRDGSATTCYRVAYAGLYWGATLQSGNRSAIDKVKFKIPGSSTYTDIQGELIYDAVVNPIVSEANEPGNTPYASYADVTSLLSGLTDIEGTYTVANVVSSTGSNYSTGLSAGWTLFIIYEDPNLHTKSFTTFDGFSHIFNGHQEVIPVSGFRTPPAGHIDLQFAYAALDGDRTKRATKLEINGKQVVTPLRPANKFFGSVIENRNGVSTPRNPFSSNTLGYDTGALEILNSEPEYIRNDDTSASFALQVARGQADPIFTFFSAFAVDVISPNIDLLKIVVDESGREINGEDVVLGQKLFYEISYQSNGNDDVKEFTITDILPDNIIFNPATDIDLSNSGGATLQSYDPVTRTLVFSVPNTSVEMGDPKYVIRLAVQIVPNCFDLRQACSNEILNQAFAAYTGVLSNIVIEEQGSYATTECFGLPQPTNFLVDISNCNFQRTEVLCGASVLLTAADGYDSYSWSTSASGTPVIGTGQTYTATEVGTYYVTNTASATCISIDEIIDVVLYGTTQENPIIPYADEVVTCPNDGKPLPNIFLCGANDTRDILTGISDAASIIWEKLDETSCAAVVNQDCANEDAGCTWNQVGTGPNYTANTSGQFRIVINYPGGCFSIFYFNVYQNLLNPTATAKDIICTTPGSITVGGVPNGYEYSIDGTNFQANNTFSISTPGYYVIYMKQTGVDTNPCIFETPSVYVRERDVTMTTNVTQPACHDDKGSIRIAVNNALPQYYYSIYESGTLVNSVGPIRASDYQFSNLNPGTYTAMVETDDGCTFSEELTIVNPELLTATAAITKPLSCSDGEITVYPIGGTPPYLYYVNSTTDFQDTPEIVISSGGVYNITVVDTNHCTTDVSVTVDATSAPEFTVAKTDITCFDATDSGTITINVSNANGNTVKFSIDGGQTFVNSSVFSGLVAGNYDVVVQYTSGAAVCESTPQTVTILSSEAIQGVATLTTPYTCSSNGTITVSGVSGGIAPYTYSIDGITFQTSQTFSNLTHGSYTVTIKDASGCTFETNEVTIGPLNPPTNLEFSSTEVTCSSNTATVTITNTTGGSGSLEYQIIAPAASATAYQSDPSFAGLAPGTYTFQVKDAQDCTYSESYAIAALPGISVVAQPIKDVTCFGASDGSAQFTVSGPDTFSYTVNGGVSTIGTSPVVLNGLGAGTYTIVVTDGTNGCNATASVQIDAPTATLAMTMTVNQMTCSQNGSVVLNATGGWGGNTYSLTLPDGNSVPSQSNPTFSNLSQLGTYTASVTDAKGCVITDTFELTPLEAIAASISTASDYCYDGVNAASLEVSVTTGQAPFEYSINNGAFQSDNTFHNLVPGSYEIKVRDANGCELTLASETIANQITLNTVLTKNMNCTATPDAEITGTISGGYAPYTYAVSINGGAYTNVGTTGSPFVYTTGTAGTYQFQITDAQGCTAQSGVTTVDVITPPAFSLVAQSQSNACHGDTNGAINVTLDPSMGTPPFVININNDTTGVNYGTQTSGLPAGTYTVTVTDAKSCTATESVIITQPDAIVVNYHAEPITCDTSSGGVSMGAVIIDSVSGGTPPYNYFVTGTNGYDESELNADGSTSYTFDVVDFGLYQINVVDANGCSILEQDVLVASPPDDLDIVIQSTLDCSSGGEAVVSIETNLAGAGPFFFSIYQGPGSVYPNPSGSWISEDAPGSKSATFSNLVPGVTYTFIVYDDSTGCSYYEQATEPIPSNSSLTTSALIANNITCTGSADGSVSFTINNAAGTGIDVSYEIYNSLSFTTTGVSGTGTVPASGTLSISNLGPLPFGNYYVLVRETSGPNAGCGVMTEAFNITESAIELSVTASIDKNANCNANSGVISATARDGAAPYMYQISTSATAPAASDAAWSSANVFNMDAGVYYVHVKDAYGCIKTIAAPLDLQADPSPVLAAVVNNQCTAVEGNFEIDVSLSTAGIAPYSFSINSGAFQTKTAPFKLSNLSSGTYTIEVKDANGCGDIVSVTIESPIGLTPAITALPSCSNDDGIITVTGTGGSGNYTYAISPNAGSIILTDNVFSGVPSGTYTITITDSVTSCTTSIDLTLNAATPVSFATDVTDVTCNGGADGMLTVNLPTSNDNPIYAYEIIAGPVTRASQASKVFTDLPAGSYTVQVTSGRACVATEVVDVNEPMVLDVSGTATDFACAADNSTSTATLTISEVGGTAPYYYSIDGTNYFSTNTFEIIDSGSTQTITIYVKDNNGCLATNTVDITPLPNLTAAEVAVVTPIDCTNSGSVEINVNGGSGNFSYQMLPDGAPQSSNTFSITAPGDYYLQVTDVDTGCYINTDVFTVAPFNEIEVVATATTAVTCFGSATGELEIDVTGYSGSYTYEVLDSVGTTVIAPTNANTSINPQVISGLTGGNYTVVVTETESPYCATTTNVVTIASPAAALSLIATETSNVTCDNNQGTITAIANGGWGTYEYELTGAATVPYSSNGTFTGLSAGNYIINVRDAGGCIASESIVLLQPTPITATFTPSTATLSCFGDQNASITVSNISGGQGNNYTYTLNTILPTPSSSGPQSSPIFGGLGAGTYNVTVNDGYNCSVTSMDIIISAPTAISSKLVASTTATCLSDATLSLSASGGTGIYSYSATADFATVLGTFTTSTTFSVPADGTYKYYVRDANGCVASVTNDITIEAVPDLTLELSLSNAVINCAGDNTGVIVATAQGGLGDYVYTLLDASGNPMTAAVQDTPGVFTQLYAGNYYVKVDSQDCTTTSGVIIISEPSAPLEVSATVTNVSCFGGNNGAVQINATGGTGVIKYAISPQMNQFFDSNIFENLAPGAYDVLVQDELGCYVILSVTVEEPAPLMVNIVPGSIYPEVCEGDGDGEFSITISGGTAPYSVSLDDYDGVYITGAASQTQFDFTGLGGGDHSVFVRDSQGCESEWNITFPESVLINPTVVIEYLCENNTPGNVVTVQVDDSITDPSELDYALNGGAYQSSNTFNNVLPGVGHYIDVRHTNGCIKRTALFDINQVEPLMLVITDGGLNEIKAAATGGTGEYQFTLNGVDMGNATTYMISNSGEYTVQVTDSSGCVASATRFFEYIDICIPNYFTPNGDNYLDQWAPGCATNYPNMVFKIFDRYGREVGTYSQGQAWDGKYKGKELPTGDYWYVVKLNDGKEDRDFVGHFTLYR